MAVPCTTLLDALDSGKSNITDGDTILVTGTVVMSASPQSYSGALENITLTADAPSNGIDLGNQQYISLTGVNGWLITNMTIKNGLRDDGGHGGCLGIDEGDLNLAGVVFENCNATSGNGGAIAAEITASGFARLNSVTVSHCAGYRGGCIDIVAGPTIPVSLSAVEVHHGRAHTLYGGGIYLTGSSSETSIENLELSYCSSAGNGGIGAGGAYIDIAGSIQHVHMWECEAETGNGGALWLAGTEAQDLYLHHSRALSGSGGCMQGYGGSHTYSRLHMHDCSQQNGDNYAISYSGVYLELNNCTIRGNYGSGRGAVGLDGNLFLSGGTEIIGNRGRYSTTDQTHGAGLFLVAASMVTPELWDAVITQNGIMTDGKNDNIGCHPTSSNCFTCGACGFGQCDFQEGFHFGDAGNRCRCWPGVKDVPNDGAPCNHCMDEGMGFNPELRRCDPCGPGQYAAPGPRGIEECHDCPMGSYREMELGHGLSSCNICPPNTYFNASTAGASSADVCVPCPSGLSSKEGSLRCESGSSGDFTQFGTRVDDLEATVASGYSDVQNDVAALNAVIVDLVAKMDQLTAIDGGIRLGTKVYCDEGHRPNADGDACEEIPSAPPAPQTLLAVSLVGNALAAVGVAFILFSGYSLSRHTGTGASSEQPMNRE